jgi:DNA-binding NarL/FixJ family response regulator
MEKSPILRRRLTRLISEHGDVSMLAFVEDIREVQKTVFKENPDMIVIDIDYPSNSALQTLSVLKTDYKRRLIMVLTETLEPRYIREFIKAGADMVFNKKDDLNKFIGHLNLMNDVAKQTPLV